ncbi:MAG: HEPN domain-containing protein [Candidatus Woesearchaeota archaeon]
MNIDKYYADKKLLKSEIDSYIDQNLLRKEPFAKTLILAHLEKAKHNLRFVDKNRSVEEFNDWTIVGLYYAAYHAALALVANKGYISKNHEVTLLFIIKEYNIDKKDIELIKDMEITKTDAEFYATLKEKRAQASYATNTIFRTEKVRGYHKKTIEFINKVEEILQ